MEAAALLAEGRLILDPALESHGLRFVSGEEGVGSGGPFARGAYVRGQHELSFSVRYALGEVMYRVGSSRIAHEELMRVVAGRGRAAYPGFSSDPLDGFRHLRDDLERYGKAFLRTMDEDFHAFVDLAQRTPPRSGFSRLSDVEAD